MAKQRRKAYDARMDEGRKRVIGIMAAILASLHMERADDLFGGPEGSPRTDRLISASIQWAERIMRKIDEKCEAISRRRLVHLAYFDEAGTDGHCPFVMFGAVVFPSGKFGWVERCHNVAIEQVFPQDEIHKFEEFHASELYLGKGPFERIEEERRYTAIRVLLMAMKDQNLPYIYAAVDRTKLAVSLAGSARPIDFAFRLCALGVEDWARSQHSQIAGTVRIDYKDNYLLILDDNPTDKELKKQLRASYRLLRAAHPYTATKGNRLWQAHDEMFFSDSRDSIGIQMADLCSYFMSCHLQGKRESDEFYNMVAKQAIPAQPEPEWSQFRDLIITHNSTSTR